MIGGERKRNVGEEAGERRTRAQRAATSRPAVWQTGRAAQAAVNTYCIGLLRHRETSGSSFILRPETRGQKQRVLLYMLRRSRTSHLQARPLAAALLQEIHSCVPAIAKDIGLLNRATASAVGCNGRAYTEAQEVRGLQRGTVRQ